MYDKFITILLFYDIFDQINAALVTLTKHDK